jgi:hypothetical protein
MKKSMKTSPNVKRRKLNPLHTRICELVRQRGGPPTEHGGMKTRFWKSIQAELRKEKNPNVPSRWEAIRKAYVTATRKGSK